MPIFQKHTILVRRALHALAALTILLPTLHMTASPAWAQSEAQVSREDRDDPIEGSWIFKIDQVGRDVSFTALNSFTAGGVVLATGSMDKLNPVSPIHGSWRRVAGNRVSAVIYFFLFDAVGNPIGMLKTDEIFLLNSRDQLSGRGSSFVCDVEGNNCSNHGTEALITISGARIFPLAAR